MGEKIKGIMKDNKWFILALAVLVLANIRYDFYFIRTGSMEPTIRTGAVVAVDPYRVPEAGEVAAYEAAGNIVIHRVVQMDEEGFIFKGDANGSPDPRVVPLEEVKGTVAVKVNAAAPITNAILSIRARWIK